MSFTLICLLSFLLGFFNWVIAETPINNPYLTVSDNNDTILLNISLSETPEWIIRWNHSVTGVTVSDYYLWDGEHMLLTDSHTPAFDAGLGHIPGRGKQITDGFNGYFILGINEIVPNNYYLMRVGRLDLNINHRIEHAGETYSLSELASNKRVKIQITVRSDISD